MTIKFNTDHMYCLTNPHNPIVVFFKKIKYAQKFAVSSNVPYTQEHLKKASETLILKTDQIPWNIFLVYQPTGTPR